ncbi:hypothetical protein [Alkaliphilus peptidifermentans]|nr:hypothetical protein [Alkaliphilus peptidifermentans]
MNNSVNASNKGKLGSFPLIDNKLISPFNRAYDYNNYYREVYKDYQLVKSFFPLLKICMPPTVEPKEIFIFGKLVPSDMVTYLKSEEIEKKYSFYIFASYPSNFPDEDITVEDVCGSIDWSLVPPEHRHIKYINGRSTGLCTHHPDGEINSVKYEHRTTKILMSAWKLYYQVLSFVEGKNWELVDLPHGDEALRFINKR